MWVWDITGGTMYDSLGRMLVRGYSGLGADKNNPKDENVQGQGPIPEGKYAIGQPIDTPTHGPYVLSLTPDAGNEEYNRSGFLIHGDSLTHPGTASHGCIIIPRQAREHIWTSGDHRLEVIAGEPNNAEEVSDAALGSN